MEIQALSKVNLIEEPPAAQQRQPSGPASFNPELYVRQCLELLDKKI